MAQYLVNAWSAGHPESDALHYTDWALIDAESDDAALREYATRNAIELEVGRVSHDLGFASYTSIDAATYLTAAPDRDTEF